MQQRNCLSSPHTKDEKGAKAPYRSLPYNQRLASNVFLYMKRCTDNDKKNFFMFRRLMMNYEPEQLDLIHNYLVSMKEDKRMPLWEVAKEAEKHRVKQIYLDARERQKTLQKDIEKRQEYDISQILSEG